MIRQLSRRLGVALAPLSVSVLVACSGGPSAMSVGGIEFSEDELLGLSLDRRLELASIVAFGITVADGAWDEPLAVHGEYWTAQRRVQRLSDEVAIQSAGVDEDDLLDRYLENPRYELTVRHIVFLSERWQPDDLRAAARAEAEAALARSRAGENFDDLAAELSEEPGAAQRGGLLQPGREGTWVPEFWDAASALEVGETSDVVETRYGFHVLRLEDRQVVPFAEARSAVVAEAARSVGGGAAWETWASERVAGIQVFPEVLEFWLSRAADPVEIIANWDGGDMTVREFEEGLAASGVGFGSLAWSDAIAAEEALVDLARTRVLSQQGAARGIPITDDDRAAIERELLDPARRWALVFGFQQGMSDEQVKSAARAAYAETGQNANLTRSEFLEWGPLFVVAGPEVLLDGIPVLSGTLEGS